MHKLTMRSRMLEVLSPESTAPESHKDLAVKILKYLTVWDDSFPEMGEYRADTIWKGMATLRDAETGQLECVNEENPEAPEWNSWAWVRTMRLQTAPVVTPATPKSTDDEFIEV